MKIRPAYRNSEFIGFHLEVADEPVGKVHAQYKSAAMLLDEVRQEKFEREEDRERFTHSNYDRDTGIAKTGEI